MLGSKMRAALLLLVSSAALSACGGGQVKAEAKVDAESDASVDFDAEGTRASRAPEGTSTGTNAGLNSDGTTRPALLGARHDVRIKDSKGTLTCQCLSVVVGTPSAPELLWSGESPTIDPSSQLVIALDSEGAPCASSNATGASYMGYSVEGGDTVVNLEPAHPGRPMTRGAIIPRPATGQLRIRAPKALPYGKALTGDGACVVKVP